MEVKENSLKAYENQGYPFDELVKKVVEKRDNTRNPIFDILFEIQDVTQYGWEQNTDGFGQLEIPGLKLRPYNRNTTTTKFDMDWVGIDNGDDISFNVMYCTRLFKDESIQLMANRYLALIESVLSNGPQTHIKALDFRTVVEEELDRVEEVTFNF
jgi:iturin family lipopeptide synthetase B